MTRSPSLCALSHSPVWFLDVEGPLRVEQRKELLLPVVLLCGEKDAAKVVAARGKREKEGCESSSVIQSEGREGGQSSHACYAAGTGCMCADSWLRYALAMGWGSAWMLAKMISKMLGHERHPVFMLRTVARGVEAHASAVQR